MFRCDVEIEEMHFSEDLGGCAEMGEVVGDALEQLFTGKHGIPKRVIRSRYAGVSVSRSWRGV
ncbi:hypothetical protein D3C86_2206280 [compost metagenome]